MSATFDCTLIIIFNLVKTEYLSISSLSPHVNALISHNTVSYATIVIDFDLHVLHDKLVMRLNLLRVS